MIFIKKYSITTISLLIALVLSVYSAFDMITLVKLFSNTSYYIILALFSAWILCIYRTLILIDFSWLGFVKRHAACFLVSLAVCAVIFNAIPPKLRIFSDEANLLGTSKSMALYRTIANPIVAKSYYTIDRPIHSEVPQRPLLFPFFTSLIHSLLGYNPNHVFALNFLTLSVLVFLGATISKTYFGTLFSIASVFLLLSNPTVLISASSGGYDLFSSVFFILTLLILYFFMKNPSPQLFSLLWIQLLLFSHSRYESIVFFPIILIGLLLLRYIKITHLRTSFNVIVLTPLSFLPLIWQYLISHTKYNVMPNKPLFSVGNFLENLVIFLENQLNFELILPYATLLHLISAVILIMLVLHFFRKKPLLSARSKHFVILSGICVGIITIIFLSHQWGVYTQPTQTRFFLIPTMALCLFPLSIKIIFPRINPYAFLVFSILIYSLYFPIAEEKRLQNSLQAYRQSNIAYDFLKTHYEKQNPLIITFEPTHYAILNYGVVTFTYANQHTDDLINELKKHLYVDILVIQEIEFNTMKPIGDNTLSDRFMLTTLSECQKSEDSFVRISKVVVDKL